MDFHLVASEVLADLQERKIRFAVIGGFALGFWGVTRSTIDMDFLVLLDDFPQASELLANKGYRQTYSSPNVAQFVHDDIRYGTIDFILASREISRAMLQRAVRFDLGHSLFVPCATAEDIIGLKLQALHNDPERTQGDLADIRRLLSAARAQGRTVDWATLDEYFALFDRHELFVELRRTYESS